MIYFCWRTSHEEQGKTNERDNPKEMGPDVTCLGMNTEDGLEALPEVWERWPVTFFEEIIVL